MRHAVDVPGRYVDVPVDEMFSAIATLPRLWPCAGDNTVDNKNLPTFPVDGGRNIRHTPSSDADTPQKSRTFETRPPRQSASLYTSGEQGPRLDCALTTEPPRMPAGPAQSFVHTSRSEVPISGQITVDNTLALDLLRLAMRLLEGARDAEQPPHERSA